MPLTVRDGKVESRDGCAVRVKDEGEEEATVNANIALDGGRLMKTEELEEEDSQGW